MTERRVAERVVPVLYAANTLDGCRTNLLRTNVTETESENNSFLVV
jgi:hypothetical protein